MSSEPPPDRPEAQPEGADRPGIASDRPEAQPEGVNRPGIASDRPEAQPEGVTPPRRGVCLVLAAAPGGGKTSVSRALLDSEPDLALSVSATTRAPRAGEQEGVHYFFRSPEQFDAMVARGELLEHARFLGRAYGTPRAPVERALAAGRDVLFDIEWQGHRQLKAQMPDDVVGIFLLPPSMAELERRLRGRGTEDEAEIARRLAAAREEMRHWDEFDHVLVNRDFAACVAEARAVLHAARTRRARQPGLAALVRALLGEG